MKKIRAEKSTSKENIPQDTAAGSGRLEELKSNVAGIDVGSETIFISTTKDEEVKSFRTFTESYLQAIEYLKEKGVTSVVMEATGVYWVAFHEMLEEAGFEIYVVNGRHVKNVPGRKTDVLDCQWLRTLHSYGLLRKSFIPEEKIRALRSYMRLRDDNVRMGSQHIQHIQKALELMNIKLTSVLSNIMGVSGLNIIRAILDGQRNERELLKLCDRSVRDKKSDEVLKALRGSYKEEHLFLLKQALGAWEFYQSQLKECDKEIEKLLIEMTKDKDDISPDLSKPGKRNPGSPNKIEIDQLHRHILRLTGGRDAEKMVGISDSLFLQLISELGTDLKSSWKTEKHFTSWLGVAPPQNRSGKGKRRFKGKINTRAGQLFRLAARGVAKSKDTALGGFYWRIKSKHGGKVANKATARKLAVMFYNIMTKGIIFVEQGLKKYQENYDRKRLESLKKQAARFNLSLVPA